MKKFTAILLAIVMIFSFAACGSESSLSMDAVLDMVKDKSGKIELSDFKKYEATEEESKYKTYTYETDISAKVVVTTDKDTGETLEVFILSGSDYVDLNNTDVSAVEKFIENHTAK